MDMFLYKRKTKEGRTKASENERPRKQMFSAIHAVSGFRTYAWHTHTHMHACMHNTKIAATSMSHSYNTDAHTYIHTQKKKERKTTHRLVDTFLVGCFVLLSLHTRSMFHPEP